MNLQINKNALLQYFAIYMSLQFLSGRVSLFLGSDLFYGFCFVFSATYIFIHNRAFREDSKYFLYLFIIVCFALITTVFTGGALSIATTLSLLSRYLMVYVAIVSNREKFIERFLRMCYVLAITSVIIFAFVQIAGQDTAMRLMSPLYEIKNTLSWMPSSYGLFFIVYNFRNGNRNSYMFGEPGLYQMVIILALYFTVFKAEHLSDKQKARYVIVFLITMITIQSTTGFMSLIVLILCIIFSNGLNINTNCGSTHIEKISEFVRKNKLSLGIAYDGDGDRCLAVDENGEIIDGDIILAIVSKYLKIQGKLNKDTLVATVMSNLGLNKYCIENNIELKQTKVGDRYVLEEMLKNGYNLGGEQSGHIILLDYNPTGDRNFNIINANYDFVKK